MFRNNGYQNQSLQRLNQDVGNQNPYGMPGLNKMGGGPSSGEFGQQPNMYQRNAPTPVPGAYQPFSPGQAQTGLGDIGGQPTMRAGYPSQRPMGGHKRRNMFGGLNGMNRRRNAFGQFRTALSRERNPWRRRKMMMMARRMGLA